MLRTKGYGRSVQGDRMANEDAFLVADEKRIYAVADGVGGGVYGDIAAQTAVRGVLEFGFHPSQLRQAFAKIHETLCWMADEIETDSYVGTTLTAGWIEDDMLILGHIGDSRCYVYERGCIQQISEDQDYYDDKMQSNVLSVFLGADFGPAPLPTQERIIPISRGSKVLFCTDGLFRQLTEQDMVGVIKKFEQTPELIVEKLIEQASLTEHSDNITLVLVEVQ